MECGSGTGQGLLADDSETASEQDKGLDAEDNSQSDHSTDDTVDSRAEAIAALLSLSGRAALAAAAGSRAGVAGVSRASTGGVLASLTPLLGSTDGDVVHVLGKGVPWHFDGSRAEKRVRHRWRGSRS